MKQFLSFFLLFCIFFSCNKNPKIPQQILQEKMEPNDHRDFMRFGLELEQNYKAYEQAVQSFEQKYAQRSPTPFDENWTLQGPGNIGARCNTVAAHPTDADVIYAGFSTGGIWKTVNGGNSWFPIFDEQINSVIGKIAIDPIHPNTIYVGTGDPNIGGNTQIGVGLFKSVDSGATWDYIGLEETYIISDILIDPTNSDNLLVSAMGLPFVKDNNRGVYRSNNGGQTWNQVLFLDVDAGVTDLAIHPSNPNRVLASGWNRYRINTESTATGDDGKVFYSDDFGATWQASSIDKPEITSRVGVCFSELDPNIAYAFIVEMDYSGYQLHKSNNGGVSFELMQNATQTSWPLLGGFGWYFGKIRSFFNPELNRELIYCLGVNMFTYDETIQSWDFAINNNVHADKHDLTRDASGDLILATDGGLYKYDYNPDFDWIDIENIPNTQFYRAAFNPHKPDLYYGGAQDNGTSRGNSNGINSWEKQFGGDGFQAAFHPTDTSIEYFETQRGNIYFYDKENQFINNFMQDITDRTAWDTPYIISKYNPDNLFVGTYRLLKATIDDLGNASFDTLSQDLTDGNIYGRSYHTLTTISESSLKEGLIYTGSSDGNVYRFEDGIWTNITNGIPDRYITSVEASPSDVNKVYVTVSGYKWNEFSPYIFMSEDKGETWQSIHGNLPESVIYDAFIYPQHNDSLIVVANDFGVYATGNFGDYWHRVGENMPIIPVNDLKHNPVNNNLIAGTYARGIQTYPLDSLVNAIYFTEVKNNKGAEQVSLYPNPSADYIYVKGNVEKSQYQIYSQQGKLIKSNLSALPIDIMQLLPGAYYLKIENKENVFVKSFVKQ